MYYVLGSDTGHWSRLWHSLEVIVDAYPFLLLYIHDSEL